MVLGDFDEVSAELAGTETHFFRRDGQFDVRTEGPGGNPTDYRVAYTAGVQPLQQYLLETEKGRLQAFDIAWDVEGQRWYRLNPEQAATSGQAFHWTGTYLNWNGRCAECHATGYEKKYDPRSRRFRSTQAEIGVGCEACHGPGEAHLAWANSPETYGSGPWGHLTDRGLVTQFAAGSPATEIEQCAGCHARREPFFGGSPLPGTPFHDAYRLALLREGLYHADESPAWAADEITRRFESPSRLATAHFAETFARARIAPRPHVDELLGIAMRPQEAGIVRATALELLLPVSDESIARRAAPLLEDPDPLVRAAAVAVQRGAEPAERVRRVEPLFDDPFRSVRIAAARGTFDSLLALPDESRGAAADAAIAEWRQSLLNMADYPETRMALGGIALALRKPRAAEASFLEAVRLDPQAVSGWIMIARIRLVLGDPDGAGAVLEQALDTNPGNETIRAFQRNLGTASAR